MLIYGPGLIQVSVVDTVVYGISSAPYSFSIVKSPVEVKIFGGFHRSAWRNGFVVMDATSSFDPDFPDSKNFRLVFS